MKTHSFKAIDVAEQMLHVAQNAGEDLTQLKLQKLLYFAHGLHLAATGTPLLEDGFEAWTYGPVSVSLRRATRRHGSADLSSVEGDRRCLDASSRDAVSSAFDIWGKMTASQLVALTHRAGHPWDVASEGGRWTGPGRSISDDLIKSYFAKLLSDARQRTA